ncbi:site-specific DNA-methyltransferase, partial [Acinetobacter baumannii]|nr:site-specific DNA-methyltransferase [Acinetobacter baumannii]
MQKISLEENQSENLVHQNIEHLKQIFPDVFSEGKVNFETLRQLLGDKDVLEEGEEKYGLNWHGKKKARQAALTPSLGTLLPYPEESVDWENTQNLLIEGDNLEVLK